MPTSGIDLVAPRPRDRLTGCDRRDQDAGHQRDQLQPGFGRAQAPDHLLVERQVGERAEQREADHEADRAGDAEDVVAEQGRRQNRFVGAAFGPDERRQRDDSDQSQPDDLRRGPVVAGAAEGGQQDDRRERDAQQNRPGVVDPVLATFGDARQRCREDRHREDPERHVDVEDPAPARVAGEEAADQRPRHAGDAEDRAEQPHVAAPLPGGDDIADRGLGADHQAAAPEALDRAEGDQLGHPVGEAAEDRSDQEEDEGGLEDDLAAVEVAELAVERRDDRDRQQVCRDDPGDVLEAAEVPDDRRQRGRDDRLIQRRQQHDQHQRPDHETHLPLGQSCGDAQAPRRLTSPVRADRPRGRRGRPRADRGTAPRAPGRSGDHAWSQGRRSGSAGNGARSPGRGRGWRSRPR